MSYLFVAFFGELDAVIRDHLMDLAVLIALGLCMADEDDEAWFDHFCCTVVDVYRLLRSL